MTLSTGTKLAHYEISSQLGKGGMGEVYQAKDQKLGRDVAIKVLPEEFAKDAERVARFQREAKLLASLNHPNIAAIYGLEEAEGTHFLVLELIEGDTLADRLKRGAIPVEESLKLALQIAEALEAAHEKGVIHRDLKPANIKVTPGGKVKVLDFGLAKAFAGDQEDMNLSNSPTLSAAATQQGIILGTAAYMSPEQARGKPVDKRTDIWAFGVVLFEMLTGRSVFSGDDVSQTLARVLERQPDFSALPSNLHPRIRFLLERCLEKDPKNRYSGINDARVEMQKVLADPGGVFSQPIPVAKPRKKLQLGIPWIASVFILGLAIAGAAVWMLKPIPPPEPKRVIRYDYHLPESQQFGDMFECAVAVSPDGSQFVYRANDGLYLHSINEMEARSIPGTDGNSERPFFSPDGKWIGFWCGTEQKLKKVVTSGGAPVTITDDTSMGSFSWNSDNTIVYSQGRRLKRISANGGTPELLAEVELDVNTTVSPQILPDGRSVLFTTAYPFKTQVLSLESGLIKELFEGTQAQYLPTGHIVYAAGNDLFAVQFDSDRLEVTGGPISVLEGVFTMGTARQCAISDSGVLVYIPGTASSPSMAPLAWVDREGNEEILNTESNTHFSPKISRDGTQVVFHSIDAGNSDIYTWNLLRKNKTRLTFDNARDVRPIWTPDGGKIVFTSNRDGSDDLYWMAADGTGKVESLSGSDNRLFPGSWSADGKILVLTNAPPVAVSAEIYMLSVDEGGEPKLLLNEEQPVLQPAISPDGRWMAYTSVVSRQEEIFVRPFPDVEGGGRWQVSNSGGDSPLWSPDGKELFYRNGDSVMSVTVETDPGPSFGTPETLLRGRYLSESFPGSVLMNTWDIHPDGNRFLMIKLPETSEGEYQTGSLRKINIVLNWFEELKERVPVE